MIWTLISIGVVLTGVAFLIKASIKRFDSDAEMAGNILILFGGLATIVAIGAIITSHVLANRDIPVNQMKYESLCKQLEVINTEYEDVSKTTVIKDIADWNQKVYSLNYFNDSPWTNWFISDKEVEALQYIDY